MEENEGNVTLECDLSTKGGTIDGTMLVNSPRLISQNAQVPLKTQQEAKIASIQNKFNVVESVVVMPNKIHGGGNSSSPLVGLELEN